MTIFYDPKEEETVVRVLKMYSEEFTNKELVVHLPDKWEKYGGAGSSLRGEVKWQFDTNNQIVIEAPKFGAKYVVNTREIL